MLKFFGNAAPPPLDQTTPRANPHTGAQEANLFDAALMAQGATNPSPATTPFRKTSTTSLLAPGARTPTTRSQPSAPLVSPTTAYFGSSAGDVTPGGPSQLLGAAPVTPGGLPTTAITKAEPDFSFKMQQPPAMARKRDNGQAPKGTLSLKLIGARHLSVPSSHSRPYVVVTYDQNEFVSREPIHEEEEEATGVAVLREDVKNPDAESKPRGNLASALSRSLNNGFHGSNGGNGQNGASKDTSDRVPGSDATAQSSVSAYNPVWKHEVNFDVTDERSVIHIQIFDRSVMEEVFLGQVEIRPKLSNHLSLDQWYPLAPRAEENVSGEIRVQIRYERSDVGPILGIHQDSSDTIKQNKKGLEPNDFRMLRMIGKGTFGRVFQVRKKDTERIYAMKVLSKREIVEKKEIAHTIGERKILQRSSECPFLLGLKFSFQTKWNLYFVMDYKSGGELFHHLQKEGRFTEDRARFYTAEIVLAFEHLHKYDIVYRDLKPENILLDATGHIVLCDFGLSKPDLPSNALTTTFCGTTEYLAPEVLLDDHGYSKLVDFWSLGVLLFEMCCGWSPFYAEDTQQMYKLICFGKVKFPKGVIGEDGKQFVKCLLNRNPKHRLGAQGDAAELMEHSFFASIDWEALRARQVAPPFKPYVDSDESVANFDPEFTEANLFDEAPEDFNFDEDDPSADWLTQASGRSGLSRFQSESGPVAIARSRRPHAADPLSSSVQENFRGFTFSGEGESLMAMSARFSNTRLDSDEDVTMS